MNHDVPVLSTFEPYNDDDDTMSIINMAFAEDNQLTVFKTEFHGMHNGRISANIDMSDEIAPYQNSRINLIYNHRHTNYAQCKPQNTAGTKYCRLTHYVYNEKNMRSSLMSLCNNDPGIEIEGTRRFSSKTFTNVQCCDNRYHQKDDYTCGSKINSLLKFGNKVFGLFEPSQSIALDGKSVFLCYLSEHEIDDKVEDGDNNCKFEQFESTTHRPVNSKMLNSQYIINSDGMDYFTKNAVIIGVRKHPVEPVPVLIIQDQDHFIWLKVRGDVAYVIASRPMTKLNFIFDHQMSTLLVANGNHLVPVNPCPQPNQELNLRSQCLFCTEKSSQLCHLTQAGQCQEYGYKVST